MIHKSNNISLAISVLLNERASTACKSSSLYVNSIYFLYFLKTGAVNSISSSNGHLFVNSICYCVLVTVHLRIMSIVYITVVNTDCGEYVRRCAVSGSIKIEAGVRNSYVNIVLIIAEVYVNVFGNSLGELVCFSRIVGERVRIQSNVPFSGYVNTVCITVGVRILTVVNNTVLNRSNGCGLTNVVNVFLTEYTGVQKLFKSNCVLTTVGGNSAHCRYRDQK